MKNTKGRIEYIDIAKGIGIALVILGHVVWSRNYPMKGSEIISNFIYSFHMPLFFIISGLCIKDTKQLDNSILSTMASAYLLPYAIWSVLYLAAFQLISLMRHQPSIISLDSNLFNRAISDCGFAPLWFLLALFISEVLVIAIKPLLKKRGGIDTDYSHWNIDCVFIPV